MTPTTSSPAPPRPNSPSSTWPAVQDLPATQKINVQLIGPNGQKGVEATAAKAVVAF
jgi:hypothetical protein